MSTCLIVIDAQESFRQRPYFTGRDLPAYVQAQSALFEAAATFYKSRHSALVGTTEVLKDRFATICTVTQALERSSSAEAIA